MGLGAWLRAVGRWFFRGHGEVKSFEREVAAQRLLGRADAGMHTIPTRKVVGSVGRAETLRSDFFYKSGKVTGRYLSIGRAMEQGRVLPPIDVYRARLRRLRGDREAVVTEYYVVDGHHRVAMARKLGQDYLDAHVVEYRVAAAPPASAATPVAGGAPLGAGRRLAGPEAVPVG
jgi:hypothetical protein